MNKRNNEITLKEGKKDKEREETRDGIKNRRIGEYVKEQLKVKSTKV